MKELDELLVNIEKKCDEITLKLPQIPQNIREILVKIAPYFSIIAVVFSVLGILAFLAVYLTFFGFLGGWMAYGVTMNVGLFGWLQMIVLVFSVYCTLMAIPGLFAQSRAGWLWLFYAQIAVAASDIVGLQFFSLIGVAIGLYILFQIKSFYPTK